MILLPSAPFRDLQFEFWTLSWFHLYVACGSAATLVFLSHRSYSNVNLALFAVAAIVLAMPILGKLTLGSAFLAGDLILLSSITEAKSLTSQLTGDGGLRRVTELYSWLIVLVPLILLAFLRRAWRSDKPEMTFLSVAIVFGVTLMVAQFRFHPFGSWALLVGGLLLLQDAQRRFGFSTLAASAASLAVLALAMQPPLRNQLLKTFPAGLTKEYAAVRTLFPSLERKCVNEPGAVLSTNDDGHYIRYHTRCGVIVNNFIMTPFHIRKIQEARTYLRMTPEELKNAAPHVRYVFVRLNNIVMTGPAGIEPTPTAEVVRSNPPLFNALIFSDEWPEGFRLVDELRVDDARDFAYARVFEIDRDRKN